MSDYSTNGSVPPLTPADAYLGNATFTQDVQLGTGSYINTAVTPNAVVPSTIVIGDSLAQIQFFSADGGFGAAYASQQSTTAVGIPLGSQSYPAGGTALTNLSSAGGYTFPQVVQVLINYGLLAGTSTLGTN